MASSFNAKHILPAALDAAGLRASVSQGESGESHEAAPTADTAAADAGTSARPPRLHDGERRCLWATELPFLVCALAALAWLPAQRALNPWVCLVLVASFAQASNVRIPLHGAGWAPSMQLAFVPMLFFAPLNLVPLMVLVSYLANDVALGRRRPLARSFLSLGDSWWTLGPVLVLAADGHHAFAWSQWPVYAAGLAAQLGISTISACVRQRLHDGERPELRDLVGVATVIDIILTLPALSVAAAAGDVPGGAELTCAALLAIAFGSLGERGGEPTAPATAGCATSVSASSDPISSPLRAPGSSTLAQGSQSAGAGAAARSRRSIGCGSSASSHDRRRLRGPVLRPAPSS